MSNADMNFDIGSMRSDFRKNDPFLEEHLVAKEPVAQFKSWFDIACGTPGIAKPNAMCLATCTKSGLPSARFVLMKGYGKDGFKFYTNYNGRKGKELTENPTAAAVLLWEPLGRSVRIEGTIERMSLRDSTAYFQSRPKLSQIGAISSNQSRPVADRCVLTERQKKLLEQYPDTDRLPKPDEWGGFIIKHHTVEFWQGQIDCLHDRIRFRRLKENEVVDNVLLHQGDESWVYERLQS